jgi:hypothetical protein
LFGHSPEALQRAQNMSLQNDMFNRKLMHPLILLYCIGALLDKENALMVEDGAFSEHKESLVILSFHSLNYSTKYYTMKLI